MTDQAPKPNKASENDLYEYHLQFAIKEYKKAKKFYYLVQELDNKKEWYDTMIFYRNRIYYYSQKLNKKVPNIKYIADFTKIPPTKNT